MKQKFNCIMCINCVSKESVPRCKVNDFRVNTNMHCEEGIKIWEQQMSKNILGKEKMEHQ